MDPRYRPLNPHDHPHTPHFLPPNCYNFTEQSHGAGFMSMGPDYWWHPDGNGRSDYPLPLPQDIREAVLREVEKERIREEIIMSEIMRRRVLEAEVRKELMMEREMGSDPPTSPSLLVSKAGWSAEETLGMALGDKEKLQRGENRGSETLPFQRGTDDLSISEVKPASTGDIEKERTLLMTKRDENVSGSKTKDVTTSSEVVNFELLADVIANKIAKEEWTCAFCQVMVTSKKDLNEHVTGKKHKSKVAAMRAQRTGKNDSIGLFNKKATKSNHMEEERVKLKAQSLFSGKLGEANGTFVQDNLPLSENPQSEHSKKTKAEVIREVQENGDDLRKKVQKNANDPRKKGCDFWCELCQVRTLSIEDMNADKLGEKHVHRSKCEQYGGTDSFNQTKSFVLDDPMEDDSGNGKHINLGKLNQPHDEVRSEDSMLLDEVKQEEREGKSLDTKVVSIELLETVNNELPVDVIASEKSKEEFSSALFQVHGEWAGKASACNVVNIELPADVYVDANKKSKEWSCALCQVICNRKKDLVEHVLGKKHKSNETSLRAQTTSENCSIRHFPKKATKLIYVEKVGMKLTAQSSFSEKAWETTSKKDDLPLVENQQSENLANTRAVVIQKVQKSDDDPGKKVQKNENDSRRKGCEFWCELCQVGTLSIEVMDAHKLGKKHVRRSRCEQYGGTDSFNQNKSSVFVDPVEDFSRNIKNRNLGKLNQALDDVSSEDCMPLDEVKQEEREGKSLDSEVVNIELPETVNNELPADVIPSEKSKEECSSAPCQVHGEWEGKASACNVVNIEPPEVVNFELPADVNADKKSKEWSCVLCKVICARKKDLDEHVLGKKHRSNEASLRAQTTGENYSNRHFPKKATKLIYVEKVGMKLTARSSFSEKAWETTSKKGDFPLLENQQSENLANTQAVVIQKVQKNDDDPGKEVQKNENDPRRKGCEFWCELCQVGTLSIEVTNAHKLGKKHVRRSRCEQCGGTDSFNQNKSSVFVDPMEDFSRNIKNRNLGKLNQALDDASSEDCMLLDEVKQEEREGKSLDSEVVNIELPEMVNNEPPADVIPSEKSKEECSSALCQVHGEWEGKASACNVVNIGPPEVVNFELPADVNANKKSKEWSCVLCKVICARKKDLDEHVLGKKHKSNEASLRAQTTGKNYSNRHFPKKATKLIYVEKVGMKLTARSLFSEKAWESTSKKGDLPLLENQQSENLANTQAVVIQKVQKNDDDPGTEVQKNENFPRRKGCEFWCELCQVGTLSIEVMNAHKLGKKHVRLSRCEQYGGIDSFNQNKSSEFVDPVEDFSRNVKNRNLGKLNQALDDVSSEDCMLLDEVEHGLRQGKSLDSEVVYIELREGVNNELPADVIASKKSTECSSTLCQVHGQREGKTSLCKVVNNELPEVVNFELPANADKKSKELSRIFCHVIRNKEKYLDEHVLGKKCNSKMTVLSARTTGKNYSTGRFPKKTTKSIYVVKEGVKLKAQSLFSVKAGKATSKKDDLLLSRNLRSENLAKIQSEVIQKVQRNEDDPRKKVCKFWCEFCQVGTQSMEVMIAHKFGKKHVRLSRCEQYDATNSFNQNMSYVLVDPVEDASRNGKNIKLGKVRQALDEVTSEYHMLLDTVGHKAREGKTLDSEVVNVELPADVTANKKSKEWSCALCQISATCEKGLNEHMLGKKHKSKKAAVRSS